MLDAIVMGIYNIHMKVRSKHNNLLNYFIYAERDLSSAYVKKCKKFFKELKIKNANKRS